MRRGSRDPCVRLESPDDFTGRRILGAFLVVVWCPGPRFFIAVYQLVADNNMSWCYPEICWQKELFHIQAAYPEPEICWLWSYCCCCCCCCWLDAGRLGNGTLGDRRSSIQLLFHQSIIFITPISIRRGTTSSIKHILSKNSFIHYGYLYSASSRLLLRSAPDPCTTIFWPWDLLLKNYKKFFAFYDSFTQA